MEQKYLFDLKHGMHLVRLYKSCTELLETGILKVKRHDADELLAIRNGAWTYDQLLEWAEEQEKVVAALYKSSPLPYAPDETGINKCVMNIIMDFHS